MKKKKILTKIFSLLTVAVLCFSLFAIPSFADLPMSSLDTDYSIRLSGTAANPVDHYLSTGPYMVSRTYTGDWYSFGIMICVLDSNGNPVSNLSVLVDNGFTQTLHTSPDFISSYYGAYGYTWEYVEIPDYGATIGITINNLPYDCFVIAFAFSDEYSDYFAETMTIASQYNYSLSARLSAPNYYDDGYQDGYDSGYITGHDVGYGEGYDMGFSSYDDIEDTVFTVVAAPFEAISNVLNFEILGINLRWVFAFILTAIILVFVAKAVKE